MTAFAHPPHPGSAISPLSQPEDTTGRDPHDIPVFNSQLSFDEPVLYLPPLLSSLPERYLIESQTYSQNPQFPPLSTETRLPDIDPVSLSLHKALHHFKPTTSSYADIPYEEAFNWSELKLPKEEEREWYCVVFRSQRRVGSDGTCEWNKRKYHKDSVSNNSIQRFTKQTSSLTRKLFRMAEYVNFLDPIKCHVLIEVP